MSLKPDLKLDWCSHEAAKFAVENWHYSKRMPVGKLVKLGVWESGKYIGCVLFGRGANNNMGHSQGLKKTEVCELVRVALTSHISPVSRIVAVSIKKLRASNPGIKLIFSYADTNREHIGTIYQAGGWLYTGKTPGDTAYKDKTGKVWHSRNVSVSGTVREFGKLRACPRHDDCEKITLKGKHRYLMPLDKETRKRIEGLAKPYPKKPAPKA
jgi:hypothetical protein